MMIFVAVLLAVTIYGASVAEHRGAQLERRLAQAQVAENLFREAARLIVSRFQAVTGRAQDLRAQSRAEREAAARLRAAPGSAPTDPTVDELDLLAQENDAVFRLFAVLGLGRVPEPAALDAVVERIVVHGLTEMGLGPKSFGRRATPKATPPLVEGGRRTDPAANASSRAAIRDDLKRQIERTHQEVVRRAAAVVALVGSLVFFTIAAMTAGHTRLILAAGGVVVAVLTAGATLAMVRPFWAELAIQLLILALLLLMLQRGRSALAASVIPRSLEPDEPGTRTYTRRVYAGHAHSPFSRMLVFAIAATALLSALTDYGYSRAAVAENNASHSAFEHESEFTKEVLAWTANRVRLFETTAQLAEARTRVAVSFARSELWYLGSAAARARAHAEVWDAKLRAFAEAYPALFKFVDDPIQGIEGPIPFHQTSIPWALPLAVVGDPTFFRAMALWDAENERAIHAHRSKTALLQALTLFAIAFYFFGQALGLGEGSGSRLLFTVGVLLALVGGAWGFKAAWTASWTSRDTHISERCRTLSQDPARPGLDLARAAAEYFYRAQRDRMDGARIEAAQEFDCAIELRPSFTAARDARLTMLEDENDYVRELGELAGFYAEAEREAVALVKAFEQSELVVPFSVKLWRERLRLWPTIFLAVAASRRGQPVKPMDQRSRDAIEKSLRRLAEEADDRAAHFDLAVSFLAVQRFKEAEREMNLGFDAHWKDGTPSYPEILRPGILDDLTVLDEYCEHSLKNTECRRLVRQMKDRSAERQASKAQMSRKIQGHLAITRVTPLGVDWAFSLAGFDSSRDSVYTRVYRVEPDAVPFSLDLVRLDPLSIELDRTQPDPAGRYTARQAFVRGSYCNDAESFTGEMYVNGQLLGEAFWTASTTRGKGGPAGMVTAVFPELNLAMCHPVDWKPLGPERLRSAYAYRSNNVSGGDPHLTRAFLTPTGAPAVFIFNQYTAYSRHAAWPATEGEILLDAMTTVRRMGLVDSRPLFRHDCSGGAGDRRILARTWRDPSGVVYVAFVFPDRRWPGGECQVMESIRNVRDMH